MRREDDLAIGQLRQQLAGLYLLKYGLAALTVWAFLFGTAVLALRGALGLPRLDLLWGLASLPVALVPAALLAWRRLPSDRALRALIDRHSRCGGLLMAGEDYALDGWQSSLPALRLPRLSWRGGPATALLAGGLAFAALGFLVPEGFANLAAAQLDVGREVDNLAHKVDVLKEEKVIQGQQAAELAEKLEQLRRDAKARDPGKTLEALDHVKEKTSRAAEDAAEAGTRKAEQLARAQRMAEALEKVAGKLDEALLTEAMHELAALVKKAASERELVEMGLDPETFEAIKEAMKEGGKLSEKQLKKLAEALKTGKDMEKSRIGRLVKAKLLDPDALEKCDKAGKCDCEGLVAFLKENGCKSDLTDALAMSEEPGKGGTSRGPGPAKLNFGDETTDDGFKFKEEELPPAALQAIKDSQLSGVSAGAPNISKEKAVSGGSGALAGAKSGGGSASTQVVLPRHRGAVERYFDRPAMPRK
jgi:hypothetical protein